jgi:hypothetical protein
MLCSITGCLPACHRRPPPSVCHLRTHGHIASHMAAFKQVVAHPEAVPCRFNPKPLVVLPFLLLLLTAMLFGRPTKFATIDQPSSISSRPLIRLAVVNCPSQPAPVLVAHSHCAPLSSSQPTAAPPHARHSGQATLESLAPSYLVC